ncbi:hypothetical protein MPTA5024_04690 [Microbispora sp. ATCC PTA-5024]|nr:hypothetical protein MPTA5024_04690 [Microbispora sp. ATCC PTA-5024]
MTAHPAAAEAWVAGTARARAGAARESAAATAARRPAGDRGMARGMSSPAMDEWARMGGPA